MVADVVGEAVFSVHRQRPRSVSVSTYLLIGAGGFLGANVRYAVSLWAVRRYGAAFPVGTLIANVAGALLIGFVLGWSTGLLHDADVRLVLVTGFLGAETTFSTFSYETVALLRQEGWRRAARNVLLTTGPGLLGAGLGLLIGQALTRLD